MSQYRPQSLPYQLKRLFDSGHATAGDVAWQLGVDKLYIEFAAKGEAKVGRGLELNIRKVLAGYRRKYPELWPDGPPIHLVTAETPPIEAPAGTPRGVFEDRDCFPGIRAFTVIDSHGVCLMRVEMAGALATRAFEQRLLRWLNRADPPKESLSVN